MIIQFKEFLKFTKQQYVDEIKKIEINLKANVKTNNKEKVKLEIENLNTEYKILISRKIKDLASCSNEIQRNMIENTYKELESDKVSQIERLQKILKEEADDLETEKIKELKTAIQYFEEIINADTPNRYILECLIDKIWIYHDKSVRFDLKPNIAKLI